ncbi:MAG TPA: ribose 5-phosphate isomerase B [Firmicutes bacterium]|uniref:Ribose 5-phosphate isomerase B n=1 Tax=Capillibacterium thermochitinicola TaxID=2699427 RepID=A0A8J6LNV7_9FIRM|nr:ribose 5-phosphate isomerase B [Capillibacterium thermochitinicola]MBA2134073.1 ribose 5-phosphate isomerase B [Capillibacterium thermochitinicola]HHW12884.1 ribose 5-phosphate isomerase B [Bacillota bacterium]
MRIAIGCDENGYEMKEAIKAHLEQRGVEYEDMGCGAGETVLYPEIARRVAVSIMEGKFDRGILICGTGLGMAIVANKIPGVRAATCHDVYSAERARKSNNAQIITFGAQVIGNVLATKLVDVWLDSEFAGGRSKPKVDLIDEIDREFRKH